MLIVIYTAPSRAQCYDVTPDFEGREWIKMRPSDCLWIVPGTIEEEGQ